jgi:hypothetical protein
MQQTKWLIFRHNTLMRTTHCINLLTYHCTAENSTHKLPVKGYCTFTYLGHSGIWYYEKYTTLNSHSQYR